MELAICASPDLLALERRLNDAYDRRFAQVSGAERHALATEQVGWAREREACGGPSRPVAGCVEDLTEERTIELEGDDDAFRQAHAMNGFCGRAKTLVERAICGNPTLLRQEEALDAAYAARRARVAGAALHDLAEAQKAWIAGREERCGGGAGLTRETLACVHRSARDRLAELR